MKTIESVAPRRAALFRFGTAMMAAASLSVLKTAHASEPSGKASGDLSGHGQIAHLSAALAAAPRRRQFKTVPFMVTTPELWDHEAAELLTGYRYKARQVWEPTDADGPWLGLMRESISGQVFAHGNSEFLAVAAVHGNAHVVMFSDAMWQKYQLQKIVNNVLTSNSVLMAKPGTSIEDSHEDVNGFYGPGNNNIVPLQKRGAVFVACHDSIHAIARKLNANAAYASSPADEIAADLTNHLIDGAVLVPSVVAFLAELQRVGYSYAKG